MEFNEKLQQLRKQKGLTQEQLAEELFVSRTAVSKWESGRGYPNIDSLKAIAKQFTVTVDELLSGDELLNIAAEDGKQKSNHVRDLIFGLLDISVIMFLFLPLFAEREVGIVRATSLLQLTEIALYLKVAYFTIVFMLILFGVLMLAFQNLDLVFWNRYKRNISVILSAVGTMLFILSPQPYAAAFLFAYLVIKVLVLVKK